MKTKIFRLSSDLENMNEIIEGLRNRKLSQKFLYLGKGANNYYKYDNSFWDDSNIDIIGNVELKKFLDKNIKEIYNEKIIFVSVACGDSLKEVKILNSYNNPNIRYIGIDYSEEMLELSKNNLINSNFESFLIRADIGSVEVKEELEYLSRGYENRTFSFLGNTFGSIKPTNIVDILSSYMNKGDKLLLDVTIKEDNIKSNLDVFNHYRNKTKENKLWRKHLFSIFTNINFPIKKSNILIRTNEDEKIGFYKIIFSLELLEKVEFELNDKVIISKGEKIDFLELYYYVPDKLIKFMKEHYFKLLEIDLKDIDGQFLFEKE